MSFPAAFSGARAPIAETTNKWARLLRLQPSDLHRLHEPVRLLAAEVRDTRCSDRFCRGHAGMGERSFRGATVQRIAISGDRAAATLSNDEIVQLRRTATGEWLIDRLGPYGAGVRMLPVSVDRPGSLTSAWDDTAQRAE